MACQTGPVTSIVHYYSDLVGSGVHVIATARRREVLTEMEEMGMDAVVLEVTDAESIAAARKEIDNLTSGRLDYLVNNA